METQKRQNIYLKKAVPTYSQSLINKTGRMMEKTNGTKNKMINYFVASVQLTV